MNGPIFYTFGIDALSIKLSNFWIRRVRYCENIQTYIKSHLNGKYAMYFFPKS